MKLKWKKYPIYWGTWIAESPKGIEYRIEAKSGYVGLEIIAHISYNHMERDLGWCRNLALAKKRCQDMEDYFDNHKINLK